MSDSHERDRGAYHLPAHPREKESFRPYRRSPKPSFILRETDKPYLVDIEKRLVEVLMSVHAGNNYAQTAAAYGIPIGTVRSRVHRARAHIMRCRAGSAPPSQQQLEAADD